MVKMQRDLLALTLLGLLLLAPLCSRADRDEEDDDDEYRKDPSYRGECNGKREDDDDYWKKTPSFPGRKYNDDFYGGCSKRKCKPPRIQGCCGTCSSSSGVQGIFTIPFNGECKAGTYQTTKSGTSAWCIMANIDVKQCCAYAVSNKAYYWQHFIPPGAATASSGRCYLYASGAPKPACVKDAANRRLDGNASTIGKSCPYGQHDPHFMGAQGTLFEFNGMPDKTFCLVTDRHLHVNMKMRGYLDTRTEGASIMKDGRAVRTWIRELGIVWDDAATGMKHTLRLAARDGKSMARDNGFLKTIEYDGQEMPLLKLGETMKKDGGLTLAFTAYEKQGGGFFDADVFSLKIEGLLELGVTLRAAHPLLQTPDDAQVHLNVQFNRVPHSDDVHGIMGQTYRPGREKRAMDYTALASLLQRSVSADSEAGNGFLDGGVKDYESSSVLAADCAFSAYGGKQLPAAM